MKRRLRWAIAAVFILSLVWYGVAPSQVGLRRTPLIGSPADFGLEFETVEFQPADQPIRLRAWWMPVKNPKAAVIMVHGGGDNRSHPYMQWLHLAGDLTARGYAIMDLDLRNHGESGDSADGMATFGVDEASDVIAAMDYVARRFPGIRYAGLGYSMGGQTVLYAAARDRRLEAAVSEATFADVYDITPRFAHASTGLPSFLFRGPFLWSAEHVHGFPLGRAHAADIIGTIAPRPVLLIHDEDDPIVPLEHCRRLAKAYPQAQVWITKAHVPVKPPWGTHAQGYILDREEYVRRVSEFYDRVFVPSVEN